MVLVAAVVAVLVCGLAGTLTEQLTERHMGRRRSGWLGAGVWAFTSAAAVIALYRWA